MKYNKLFIGAFIATFCLTAYGFISWNGTQPTNHVGCKSSVHTESDFINTNKMLVDSKFLYMVESRFNTTITKGELDRANSIIDIVPKHATRSLVSYKNVKVGVLHDEGETIEAGKNESLNQHQIALLKSTDYSSSFYISADCNKKNEICGKSENYSLVYYITVVPERKAEYTTGQDDLIKYLKDNSIDATMAIKMDQLKPGRVNFTVSKSGYINDVNLESTSGFQTLDKTMTDLISNIPGKWKPAVNENGVKVDQQLIFFYGIAGC